MTDVIAKTIEIIFDGTDNVSNMMSNIDSGLTGMGDGMNDLGAPFLDAAKALTVMETAVLAASGAIVVARAKVEEETNKMTSALGLPTAEVERFKEIAENVYGSGFGGELEDAFALVTFAAQKFSKATSYELEELVTYANKLNYAFEVDTKESLSAANSLMKDFGLTGQQAYDFIVAGMQDGLNGADDFLESITEYSTQFKAGGASADEFYSIMKSGYQEGILGTDKAADAFKEFRIRIMDGSDGISEALKQIGLDDSFVDSISKGEITSIQAFNTIIDKLKQTDDQAKVMQVGVALIGIQFEDLGTQAALAINTTNTKLVEMKGKVDAIDPEQNLAVKFQSAFNTIKTAIIDDDIWDQFTVDFGTTIDKLKENFVQALNNLSEDDFAGLLDSFNNLQEAFSNIFDGTGVYLTSVEGIQAGLKLIIETVSSINNTFAGMSDEFGFILDAIVSALKKFNDLDGDTQHMIGTIISLGAQVAVGGTLVAGVGALAAALSGPVGLVALIGATAAALPGMLDAFTRWYNQDAEAQAKKLEAQNQALEDLLNKLDKLPVEARTVEIETLIDTGKFAEAEKLIDAALVKDRELKVKALAEEESFKDAYAKIEKLGNLDEKELSILANADGIDQIEEAVKQITADRELNIKAKAETKQATEEIEVWTENHGVITVTVPVKTDGIDDAKKEIEKIPTEKQLEIKLQGDIDKEIAAIEAQAKVVQSSVEWEAKLDISKVEAATEVTKSAFDSIGQSVTSVTEGVSSMFSSMVSGLTSGNLSYLEESNLWRYLEQEQKIQEELVAAQIELTGTQTDYYNKQIEKLSSGDATIKIDSTGLEPSLELVMWQILQKIQVKANESASSFLLGIS